MSFYVKEPMKAPFLFYDDFYSYLQEERRYSEHTVQAYLLDLTQFFEFLGIQQADELIEVTTKVVRGWLVHLKEKDYTNKSINRKLSSVRTYFHCLRKKGVADINPVGQLRGPKVEKRLPQFANEGALIRIDMEEPGSFAALRDHLMIELLYQTGIRLSELIGLTQSDVSGGKIKVLGKRNKERIVPISKNLQLLIDDYLEMRENITCDTQNLLVTNSGHKLYSKFVYRKINNYLGRATELEKCSPHVLRHTFATHMLNNGAGIETIKELLGHASLSATQVYTHNSFAQLTNIYSLAHPRGHKNR